VAAPKAGFNRSILVGFGIIGQIAHIKLLERVDFALESYQGAPKPLHSDVQMLN